jgi:hypothetical protein
MIRFMFRPALLCGVFFVLTLAFASAQERMPARQTDQQLLAKLHELTRAKGEYVKRGVGFDFCRRLGVRPIGNCEVFRVQFFAAGRPAALFYSLDDGRTGVVRIFVISLLDRNYVDDFRVDLEGRLERAVRRRGDISSRLSVIDATPGFKRLMEFLHSQQDQLTALPNATLIDDGSCPKGQIKRVAGDPRQVVCLDRARLRH